MLLHVTAAGANVGVGVAMGATMADWPQSVIQKP